MADFLRIILWIFLIQRLTRLIALSVAAPRSISLKININLTNTKWCLAGLGSQAIGIPEPIFVSGFQHFVCVL